MEEIKFMNTKQVSTGAGLQYAYGTSDYDACGFSAYPSRQKLQGQRAGFC